MEGTVDIRGVSGKTHPDYVVLYSYAYAMNRLCYDNVLLCDVTAELTAASAAAGAAAPAAASAAAFAAVAAASVTMLYQVRCMGAPEKQTSRCGQKGVGGAAAANEPRALSVTFGQL